MPQFAISAVTAGELRLGAARVPYAKRLHALIEAFLLRMTILPWDSNAARHYGQLRSDLEREGQPTGNLDMSIHPDQESESRGLDQALTERSQAPPYACAN
jgi:tRNA(fMet)-specific endonuclease VapC